MASVGQLELTANREVYRKVIKQASMQVSGSNQVHSLLRTGYVMVVGNQQCNAANPNQSKPQFQLELRLAQFSPSLFLLI